MMLEWTEASGIGMLRQAERVCRRFLHRVGGNFSGSCPSHALPSQIILVSNLVVMELGIPYDPTVSISMQSANGTLDKSLGLVRNIPVKFGDLTFYLQMHVFENPPFDILLGRPFDKLTRSVIRNFANNDQTITLVDPNTERTCTLPTRDRTFIRLAREEDRARGPVEKNFR